MKNRINNRGFSMVEILAVVVILGVVSTIGIVSVTRIVENSRDHYFKSQNESFIMAAKAYANDNRQVLPKVIGGSNRVYLKTLIEKKYLKEDIKDQKKNNCDRDLSYVKVFKKTQGDYSYVGYLNCPSCKKESGDEYCNVNKEESPEASVLLTVEKTGSNKDMIKTAHGTLNMKGNSAGTKELYSYSFKVYKNGALAYNSGIKRVKGQSKVITIDDILVNNVPGSIKVVLTVTNEDGYSKSASKSYNYNDIDNPHCGDISGQGKTKRVHDNIEVCDESAWITTTRRVFIQCKDVKGSGCKMEEFAKNFTTESKDFGSDTMTVEDVHGNKTTCTVFPCIDRANPTLTIKVYKRLNTNDNPDDYKNVTPLKTYTINTEENNIRDLTTDIGWFNKNYPYGVYFGVNAHDANVIKSYKVEYNDGNLYKSAADSNKFKNTSPAPVSEDNIYKIDINKKSYLADEGRRYIRFTLKDGAGNVTKVAFKVEIDRTSPTIVVNAGRCVDGTAAQCKAANVNYDANVTVNNNKTTDTINKLDWAYAGLKIKYNISDKNDAYLIWKYNNSKHMNDRPEANSDNNKQTTLEGITSLTSHGQRQGNIIGEDAAGNKSNVLINVNISNKCVVSYYANGGVFNSNASSTYYHYNYQKYLDNTENTMRSVRGTGSFFYGTLAPGYVLSTGSEWSDGVTTYNQNDAYPVRQMCPNMGNGEDQSHTLSALWIADPPKFHIYDIDYQKKKCSYKKSSKKMLDRPYRTYSLHSWSCRCEYRQSDSYLEAKAYFKRHVSKNIAACTLIWKDSNQWQRDNCFNEVFRIYYRKTKNGKKSCKNTDGYPINTNVYQACATGKVYGVKTAIFFHGVFWYWGNAPTDGTYYSAATKDYWLINDQYYRMYYPLLGTNYHTTYNNTLALYQSYEYAPWSSVQQVCTYYCASKYGYYRSYGVNPPSYLDDGDVTNDDSDGDDGGGDDGEEDYVSEDGDDD